ncbi:fluoride efflux transporter CrcB [Saccharomonospora azurea]|uniref:Fluoride-specific ion channel FluC n=1 Tax=Saccharomonospora azurea NA-128 TaxID=882081 RepID=H8GF82_9PSEU|nr:fluoride efflux transporter CrcB [Saccharomonospora azurea]EHY88026.1 crcB protein [Saccharomonospora azurea NA-128]
MTVLLVALGGAAGATGRYLLDTWLRRRQSTRFPLSTLVVNVLGSLVLGVVAGTTVTGAAGDTLHAVVGVGFCGALTTFSTFGYETLRVFLDGARTTAVANVVATTGASIGAAAAGLALGGLLG